MFMACHLAVFPRSLPALSLPLHSLPPTPLLHLLPASLVLIGGDWVRAIQTDRMVAGPWLPISGAGLRFRSGVSKPIAGFDFSRQGGRREWLA